MSSPWSASREGTLETSRLIIERAHEELVSGNFEDRRLDQVRQVVRESWERSWKSRAVTEGIPPLAMFEEELEAYRRTHPLASVMEMVRALLLPGDAEHAGVMVAVGDEAGRLLWVEGDLHQRLMTGDVGFVAGANWAEDAIGTSAPGTALRIGESVQIRQAEHYNRLVQPWSCTAAPVFDPETRKILGVIDVTGGPEVTTPQAQLLVDATARAVETQLLVSRLKARASAPPVSGPRRRKGTPTRATLHVLGRDRARLEVSGEEAETVIDLSARHAEILLMLAVHRQGLSAERLAELVYGEGSAADTLRPEVVRLRKVLERVAPSLVPESRPYRLAIELETDAHNVLALLGRGAHRVALSAYRGPALPESTSPGVEEFRESVRAALREAMLTEASIEVLLLYADIPEGAEDEEILRLCLEMLPARSPRRASLVTRIERLAQV
ncbi:AfsR/SARP family transcriptional regulator [Microbacterium tumbae]